MSKRKANHVIPGMNAAKSQGMGVGYNEEFTNEPLTEKQKLNKKGRKINKNNKAVTLVTAFRLIIW